MNFFFQAENEKFKSTNEQEEMKNERVSTL